MKTTLTLDSYVRGSVFKIEDIGTGLIKLGITNSNDSILEISVEREEFSNFLNQAVRVFG